MIGGLPAISKKAWTNMAAVAAVLVAFGLIAAKNLRANGSNHRLSAAINRTEALHQSVVKAFVAKVPPISAATMKQYSDAPTKLGRSPIIPIAKDGDEANGKFFAEAATFDSFWKSNAN